MKKTEKENQPKILRHNNHKKPVTRRDFLAMGALGSSSLMMMPSILGLLSKETYASGLTCPELMSTPSSMIPFHEIDLAGGAAISGVHAMVGGPGGQKDVITGADAYKIYGLPDELNYNVPSIVPNTEFGIAFHPQSSFLNGLLLGFPDSAKRQSVDGYIAGCITGSDTDTNPIISAYHISSLGRYGTLLPAIGSDASQSGGHSAIALGSGYPAGRPIRVINKSMASNIVSNATLQDILTADKAAKIRAAIQRMGSSQLETFNNKALPDQLKTLIDCNYLRANDLPKMLNPNELFPPNDPEYNQAFRTQTLSGTVISTADSAHSVAAKLLHTGKVGTAVTEISGFDTHDGTSVTSRRKLQLAGFIIGQLLYYAALLNRPVFICTKTDGSMNSSGASGITPNDTMADILRTDSTNMIGGGGQYTRQGDADAPTGHLVFCYIPGSKRGDIIANPGRQVGAFTKAGVDRSSKIGANPQLLALHTVKSYLDLHGLGNLMSKIGTNGRDPFAGADEYAYTMFKKPG